MPSALLVLGFGSILLAGLLLTSSLRNRSIGEILDGLTSPNTEGAQTALGAPTTQAGAENAAASGGTAPAPLAAGAAGVAAAKVPQEKTLVQAISKERGWNASNWEKIIELESGWSPTAVNKSSGAFGIGQFLGATKTAFRKYGSESTNPLEQIIAMGDYIKERYGNPSKALEFHLVHNYY